MVALGAVAVGLGVSVPAAYAFSRFSFFGRRFLLVQFLVINMFPIVLLIIPLFVLMRMLGLIDTYLGILVGHSTFAIPFSIWMMTSYMNSIPRELDEAAIVDGASRLQTIRLIILPLAMPGIVTTGDLHLRGVVERVSVRDDAVGPERAHRHGGAAALHRRIFDPVGPADRGRDGRRHSR